MLAEFVGASLTSRQLALEVLASRSYVRRCAEHLVRRGLAASSYRDAHGIPGRKRYLAQRGAVAEFEQRAELEGIQRAEDEAEAVDWDAEFAAWEGR